MSIADEVHALFIERGWTLALAESLTGGLLASTLVAKPDASRYFLGSVVAYSNEAKERILGVLPATLSMHGAVSEEAAREMALGARLLFKSDFTLAVTGIAGPSGGRPGKEVGTVCFSFCSSDHILAWTEHLTGDRLRIMEKTVDSAFSALLLQIKK